VCYRFLSIIQELEGGGHDDTKGPPEHTEAGGDWSIDLAMGAPIRESDKASNDLAETG